MEVVVNAEKYIINNKSWQQMAFTFVNPTANRITLEPFNPQVSNTLNYPTSPTGISTPPSVYTPISIPRNSQAVEYNSNLNEIWAGQTLGGSRVMIYDEVTQSISNFVDGALFNITSISYSVINDKMIIGSSTGVVSIYNATTKVLITTVLLPAVGVNWIEYNSNNNTWVITQNGDIVIIDCVTNAIIFVIVTFGLTPQRVVILPSNIAYVTEDSTDVILKVDLTINTVVLSVPSLVVSPIGIGGYVAALDKIFIGSQSSLGIWTFSTLTDTFVSNIAPTQLSTDFFFHTSSNSIYAIGFSIVGKLLRFDATTNTLQNTNTFPQALDRLSLAFSQFSGILYSSSVNGTAFPDLNSFLPSQGSTLYITGDSNYNQVVRDSFNSPFLIRRLYFYSQNVENFKQTFFLKTKDSNGNVCDKPQVPSLSVSTMQFQNGIGMVDYPNAEFIIGINQWYKGLTIEANSEITMILIYQQAEKSALLSGNGYVNANSNFDNSVANFNQIKKYTTEEVDENYIMPLNISKFNEGFIKQDVIME